MCGPHRYIRPRFDGYELTAEAREILLDVLIPDLAVPDLANPAPAAG